LAFAGLGFVVGLDVDFFAIVSCSQCWQPK